MEWLKENSAAIQALASVATLLVTLTLAVLTGRYLRVTKSIAGSAMDQVRHLRDSSRALTVNSAQGLVALSTQLRVPLDGLKAGGPTHRNLREYSLLSEADILQLEALARQVSGDAARFAGKAAVSLKRLSALIARARSVNESTGWVPSRQEGQDWDEAIDAGPKMLSALEDECRKVAAT